MAKTHFTKWDTLPIVGVAALAIVMFLLFLPGVTPGAYAEVYRNGVLLKTLPLEEDASFVVQGEYTNVVTVRQGKVAVTETDCPGGDCKTCGWFSRAGSIVCLPNGLEVRVVAGIADVDVVVG